MPFHLARPGAARVDALLAALRDAPCSYAEVGATRGPIPAGWTVDHHRAPLGAGPAAFAAAVAALRAWRMLTLGWVMPHPAAPPVAVGACVAVVARHLGFWSVNPCRIVYLLDEERDGVRRWGFAYGTLPAHAAVGEERFAVEWRAVDDAVHYDLLAMSRPGHPLARLGRPFARRLQRRFGVDSPRAMQAAVRAAVGDAAAGRR